MNDRPSPIPLRPDANAMREAAVTSLVRSVIIAARSHRPASAGARNAWPNDRLAHSLVTRAPVEPTSPADVQGLRIAVQFIASLAPISAAAAIIAASLQVRFDGAASLAFPTLSLPNAVWISDDGAIPVVQGQAGPGVTLDPHKLGTSLVLTSEMMNSTNAEAIVRQVLGENVGPTLDAALFSTAAGVPGLSPPGLLAGVPPLASTGDLVEDVVAIGEALAPAAGSGTPVIVAAPGVAARLVMTTLRTAWPVYASAALAPGTIVGLVAAAIATAVDTPRIESSSQAVMHMEDASPAVDIGGGTMAVPLRSTFQADSVSVRFILPASWALRSPAAVAWIDGSAERRA